MRSPCPKAASDVPVPVAVSAVWTIATTTLDVTFSGPLQSGLTDRSQWGCRLGSPANTRKFGSAGSFGTVSGSVVSVVLPSSTFDPSASGAFYTASIGDLFSASGVPIPAQSGIPLSIV